MRTVLKSGPPPSLAPRDPKYDHLLPAGPGFPYVPLTFVQQAGLRQQFQSRARLPSRVRLSNQLREGVGTAPWRATLFIFKLVQSMLNATSSGREDACRMSCYNMPIEICHFRAMIGCFNSAKPYILSIHYRVSTSERLGPERLRPNVWFSATLKTVHYYDPVSSAFVPD